MYIQKQVPADVDEVNHWLVLDGPLKPGVVAALEVLAKGEGLTLANGDTLILPRTLPSVITPSHIVLILGYFLLYILLSHAYICDTSDTTYTVCMHFPHRIMLAVGRDYQTNSHDTLTPFKLNSHPF